MFVKNARLKQFKVLSILLLLFCFSALPPMASAFWPFDGAKEQEPKPKQGGTTSITVNKEPLTRGSQLTTSFAPVVKLAAPSVVSVYTTKKIDMNLRAAPFPFSDPFFRRFFGDPQPGQPMPQIPQEHDSLGLGSGVLVSEDGYVVTNNHVIEGADEVRVSFALKGEQMDVPVQVIGSDPKTDVAVLKIPKDKIPQDARPAVLADSDLIEVGDLVLAIGNPFGLSQTVTLGIISARGRNDMNIIPGGYEDFIQTDASINPGNSGGALVDAQGRVIGINTAIFSRSGGNQGIGFAVPINLVQNVMGQIITSGRVSRGFLGVNIQDLTSDLASAFGLPDTQGALVSDLVPQSPADKAGVKQGDVIIELNGQPVSDSRQLRLTISQLAPGTKVTLKLIREGKPRDYSIVLGELKDEPTLATVPGSSPQLPSGLVQGMELVDLDDQSRQQLGLDGSINGALVKDVDPQSPAFEKGIRPGDVIMEINRNGIANAAEARKELAQKTDKPFALRVWKNGGNGPAYLAIPPTK